MRGAGNLGQAMGDGFTKLKNSGVSDEVREDRGYAEYARGDADPIFDADPRLRDGTYFVWEKPEKEWKRKAGQMSRWGEDKASASAEALEEPIPLAA